MSKVARLHVMRQKSHKTTRPHYPALQYGPREILVVMTPQRIERFLSRIDTAAGGVRCQPWTGSPGPKGYGLFQGSDNYQGFSFLAHRVAWALAHQTEPGTQVIRHSCDNPPCCNPRHLLPGTQADNAADMLARGRANLYGAKGRYGADANAARYIEEQREQAIAMRFTDGRKINDIAAEVGCHRATIMRWIAEWLAARGS